MGCTIDYEEDPTAGDFFKMMVVNYHNLLEAATVFVLCFGAFIVSIKR